VDGMTFDDVSRAIAQKMPRRGALRMVAASLGVLASATLVPSAAMAKETPAFHSEVVEKIKADAKKGRKRKKKKARRFYAQCAADASTLENECGAFCYAGYGFNTDLFLACAAQCVSCVPYVYHCAVDEATLCLNAFDAVW
jgi:hypothetical protein